MHPSNLAQVCSPPSCSFSLRVLRTQGGYNVGTEVWEAGRGRAGQRQVVKWGGAGGVMRPQGMRTRLGLPPSWLPLAWLVVCALWHMEQRGWEGVPTRAS